MGSEVTLKNESTVVIELGKDLYSKPAILRSCYWLQRDLCFQIAEKESHFEITASLLCPKPTLDNPVINKIGEYIPALLNALIDNELRLQIQTETSAIRELIIAKAFAESGILEDAPPGTFEDPVAAAGESRKLIKIATQLGD